MAGIDFNALFQQAQAIQQEMEKAQAELAKKTVTGTSGGGMVTVTATGKGDLIKIQIDPQAVDARDVPMLEDLVLTAVNAALAGARELAAQMGSQPLSALQGMIPGMPK
jgi:DNA-binding YbaB/EbfC family protein